MMVHQIFSVRSNPILLFQNTAVNRRVLNMGFCVVHIRWTPNAVFTKSDRPNVLELLHNMLIGG